MANRKNVSLIDAELNAHDAATIAHVQAMLDAAMAEIVNILISETINPLRALVRDLRMDLDQVRMLQHEQTAIHDQQFDAVGVRIGALAREIEQLKTRFPGPR